MNLKLASLVGMFAVAANLSAAPQTFDFKDPKGVNNIIFELDAPLEAINGSATGITGSVQFDPANPASVSGRIIVATSSMSVPNPTMKEHLHGDKWMDVSKHPEITFVTEKVANASTKGNVTTANVTGKMTIRGVSKTMTVPVTLTYLKDKLKDRGGPAAKDGDILVLRSNFSVLRSDFGINPGQFEDKVSNEIKLKLSIAGFAPR
ncbi:MAG: YceI family protein [Verrucomicrobiota bacterium]